MPEPEPTPRDQAAPDTGAPSSSTDAPSEPAAHEPAAHPSTPAVAVRSVLGGVLMGLANLVPGISGGTMLLTAGVYPAFVGAVAEVSTLRFRFRSLLVLGCVALAAIGAIVGLAGIISELVVERRWVMYSLFIGLTLGGVPVLWSLIRRLDAEVALGAAAGLGAMVAMAFVGPGDPSAADGPQTGMLLLAGLAGASAMVLPGISGSYLLVILGQYVPILSAVAEARDAVSARDWSALAEPMQVIVPVGIGVVVGVVVVSNVVRWLLGRVRRPTLGVLLGLLLGAVIGLWPFQRGEAPEAGTTMKGDVVVVVEGALMLEATGRPIEPADYPTVFFAPSIGQVAGSFGLILVGFAVAFGVSHVGKGQDV